MAEAPLGLYMCADYLFHFFFKMAAVHFKMVTADVCCFQLYKQNDKSYQNVKPL